MKQQPNPPLLFDEFRQVEWSDPDQIAAYERKAHPDSVAERDLLAELGVSAGDSLIDFGSGTGVLVLEAARICSRVIAVDTSAAMLAHTRVKAERAGVENIEFVHAGFLTYQHDGDPVDLAVSERALHSLPDFWKVQALHQIAGVLKLGGTFYLNDLVYSFEPADAYAAIEYWIETVTTGTDRFPRSFFEEHVRAEYSTYSWLLEAMLREAGFEITDATYRDVKAYARYTCVKTD